MSDGTKTLYERLGGYNAIAAVANDLLSKLRADPQLGRFAFVGKTVSCARSSCSSISSARARADQCTTAVGTCCLSTEACASVIATGMCSSVMPPRPWRSSRFLRPNSATWSRLFRVSKKNALNVDVRISRLPTRRLSDFPIHGSIRPIALHESVVGPSRPILRWNRMSAFRVLRTSCEADTKRTGSD